MLTVFVILSATFLRPCCVALEIQINFDKMWQHKWSQNFSQKWLFKQKEKICFSSKVIYYFEEFKKNI